MICLIRYPFFDNVKIAVLGLLPAQIALLPAALGTITNN
jgi:hypothetical protein